MSIGKFINGFRQKFRKPKPVKKETTVGNGDPRIPPWKRLVSQAELDWRDKLASVKHGSRVLIANNLPGYNNGSVVESVLAAALVQRGAAVDVLQCEGTLSACLNLKIKNIKDSNDIKKSTWKEMPSGCVKCRTYTRVFSDLGVPILYFKDYLTEANRAEIQDIVRQTPVEEIKNFKFDSCAIGEHANAGVLRYFAKGDASGEPLFNELAHSYFEASLQTYFVMKNLLAKNKYDVAVFHHGIYVPQGIVGEVCRAHGVRVVNWNPAYRKKCFIFSHENTYHHTLMSEPISAWEGLDLKSDQFKEINSYLESRTNGKNDWIWFHNEPDLSTQQLVKETGIDPKKKTIGLLTNVYWDAQLHYPENAFPDMMKWLLQTIRYFAENKKDLQLLIRIHPAEIRGLTPSRQLCVDEIKKAFPNGMPSNIFVIPPESEISTYSAMDLCDSVIIFGTKTGVELTSRGIPVIVAGEAWIKNKGLTIDANTQEEYFRILEGLPIGKRLSEKQRYEALKYAYHFFFRRMIPIDCFHALEAGKKMPFEVRINSLQDLAFGLDPGLDVICDGILKGAPFIYPYEKIH